MIRFCTEKDKKSIIKIWNDVFKDSPEEIEHFLEFANVGDAPGLFIDGELVSFLFLLDSYILIDGQRYSAKYVYAACTVTAYRGRGYMGELLGFAKRYCSENSVDFLTLVPAEDSLFSYYERFGYKNYFYACRTDSAVNYELDGLDYMSFDEPMLSYARKITDESYIDNLIPAQFCGGDNEIPVGMALALSERAKTKNNHKVFFNLTMG